MSKYAGFFVAGLLLMFSLASADADLSILPPKARSELQAVHVGMTRQEFVRSFHLAHGLGLGCMGPSHWYTDDGVGLVVTFTSYNSAAWQAMGMKIEHKVAFTPLEVDLFLHGDARDKITAISPFWTYIPPTPMLVKSAAKHHATVGAKKRG